MQGQHRCRNFPIPDPKWACFSIRRMQHKLVIAREVVMKQGSLRLFFTVAIGALVAGVSLSGESQPRQPTGDRPFEFKLTKGHGLPVCEAYLQRLNNTPFDNVHRPYCDRPE